MDPNLPVPRLIDAPRSPVLPMAVEPEPTPKADEAAAEQKRQAVEAFLALARKRWKHIEAAESTMRAAMLEDLRFLQPGGQWPEEVKHARKLTGDPCLEVDRLTGACKQVNNQQRQMRPSIQVNPVDSGADPKTAEVLQGIIRHIEVSSDADTAYDTAGEHQVKMGRGYVRVITEYESDQSFNQRIKIVRVPNPFAVYLDPGGVAFDGSDKRYGFVIEDMPDDVYDSRFGEGKAKDARRTAKSLAEMTGLGNPDLVDWFGEGTVRVAQYYYADDVPMVLIQDPQTGQARRVTPDSPEAQNAPKKRTVYVRQVFQAVINGVEVLEGNDDQTAGREWPGQYIPIVPMLGDETYLDGRVDYQGLVRRSRDAQRMANYWKSYITGQIALANRTPWIVAEGQLEGHEPKWKTANRIPYAYLEYKPVTLDGKVIGPPQKDRSEPPIGAATAALGQNEADLRAVTGWVDVMAHEGATKEQSGRAILARQHQAELGNSNYIDNSGRTVRGVGRIVLDMVPRIYDAARVMRLLGNDGKAKTVLVHAGAQQAPDQKPEGVEAIYDLGVGTYDVTISVGPSHQTMRQEAADAMLSLMQALPQQAPVIAPVWLKNVDWPGALEAAKAIQKTLPPQFQEPEDGQPQVPPALMQKIASYEQLIDAQTAKINQLTDERNGKLIELESKERVAMMQIQADLTKAEAQINAQNAQTLLTEQNALIRQRLDHLTDIYQAERQQAADQQMASQQIAAQQQQAAAEGQASSSSSPAAPAAPSSDLAASAAQPAGVPPVPESV